MNSLILLVISLCYSFYFIIFFFFEVPKAVSRVGDKALSSRRQEKRPSGGLCEAIRSRVLPDACAAHSPVPPL